MSNINVINKTRMCKVFVTFEGSEGTCLTEFFITIPHQVTDYESAAKSSVGSWLVLVVDPLIDYEIEVCPPFLA